MKLLPSAAEMRTCDQHTIAAGVSASDLMERAGAAVTGVILEYLKEREPKPVLVLCGPGNNGGDGLVIARLLLQASYEVEVVVLGADKYSQDFLVKFEELKNTTISISSFGKASVLQVNNSVEYLDRLDKYSLIVDCLLGTGQKGSLRGVLQELISQIKSQNNIISVDVPTGVDADTGQIFDDCVTPMCLVSIQALKRGLAQFPAKARCRESTIVDIGIDMSSAKIEFSIMQSRSLSQRALDSHKSDFGHVKVVAGSKNMPGAAILSANAALTAGAGLVTVYRKSTWSDNGLWPEVMRHYVSDSADSKFFSAEDLQSFKDSLGATDTLVVGPGLGNSTEIETLVKELLKLNCLTVLDADGLNVLAKNRGGLNLGGNVVITPHPGEAARLLGTTSKTVQSDRYRAAKELYELTGAVVVLKGAASIVYYENKGFVCDRGSPYLATPGSGDVLAGVVAALLAQRLSPVNSATTAVRTHAIAGEHLIAEKGGFFRASELIPKVAALLLENEDGKA